ncbi:uncharacterized protein LOC128202466 [Galleria mellonella]|uniref:Uncharacterized protein LOC128202466 n=1 Tax=Galleria mellonella TaxID=7137 RepID=A0ABM3N5M2_GALME|nr:uncharacterized protein LOC128202466 [Galleria mellonella]
MVGAAVVVHNPDGTKDTTKFKLHSACTVFQAELLAISKAVEWIANNNIYTATIFTDSKSGLEEIANPNTRNPQVVSIHHTINRIREECKETNFVWVKAHAEIEGNEEADVAAKSAAHLHKILDYDRFPISYEKYINSQRSNVETEKLYTEIDNSKYIKILIPTYELLTQVTDKFKPDFEITQYLTNHGYHREYLHRFCITDGDACQ